VFLLLGVGGRRHIHGLLASWPWGSQSSWPWGSQSQSLIIL
jgi:hypothetical protein